MSSSSSSSSGAPGQFIGNYQLTGCLGRGGMGVVYVAVHRQIGRKVAIKLLYPRFAKSAEFAARFLREAQSVNVIKHPGLVQVFDFGQRPGTGELYLVMEHLEGITLRKFLSQRGAPTTEEEALTYTRALADALAAAHDAGIIHRDLKPENVMLTPDPETAGGQRVKILDFGIAKVPVAPDPIGRSGDPETLAGVLLGTPVYMAPEQHGNAGDVDGSADVFSLGAILYELLAGMRPFVRSSTEVLLKPPPAIRGSRPDISNSTALLLERMLSPAPSQRPTMRGVVELIDKERESARGRSAGRRGMYQAVRPALGLLSAMLMAYGVLVLRPFGPPDPARLRAMAIATLQEGLRASDPILRRRAAAVLARAQDMTLHALVLPLLNDQDQQVAAQAAVALGQIGAPDAITKLAPLLDSERDSSLRTAVAGALAQLGDPSGERWLLEALNHEASQEQRAAALLLAERGHEVANPVLQELLNQPELPVDALLPIASLLARSGLAQARQRLDDLRENSATPELQLTAAGFLARLGDDQALAQLRRAAVPGSSERSVAARLLLEHGDFGACDWFAQTLSSPRAPAAQRTDAAEALAACARNADLAPLSQLLRDRSTPLTLRMASAGAMLSLLGGDPRQQEAQSLRWARFVLDHTSSAALKSTALLILSTNIKEEEPQQQEETVVVLNRVLKDKDQELRRGAARALGASAAHSALSVLALALADGDAKVRSAGIQGIEQVAQRLKQQGDPRAVTLARQYLSDLAQDETAPEHLAASAALARLGDQAQAGSLLAALHAADPAQRRMAVDLSDAPEATLVELLRDDDHSVSFRAACKLASRGQSQGLALLRRAHAAGGLDSLVAYGLLRRLGQPMAPPAGMEALQLHGALPERTAVVEALSGLSPVDALPFVRRAAQDLAAVIRLQALSLAVDLSQGGRNGEYLLILRNLLSDPEGVVRARAAAQLDELLRRQGGRPAAAADAGVDAAPPISEDLATVEDLTAAPDLIIAEPRGWLVLEGEDGVRVQVDGRSPQTLPLRPLALSPGVHRVKTALSNQEVRVDSEARVPVAIKVSLVEQLLRDADDALTTQNLAKAQRHLDGAQRRLKAKPAASPALHINLLRLRGKLEMAREHWLEAITAFETLHNDYSSYSSPEVVDTIKLLAQHVGRIEIERMENGRCKKTHEWVPPGENMVDLDGDRKEKVRVGPGKTANVGSCGGRR